jgi:hypothetical protein
VLNHARRSYLRREIDDGPDYTARFNGRGDHAARIDAFQMEPIPLSPETLKVPPGNSILGADDGGVRSQYEVQLRHKLGKAVRLHSQKHDVCRSGFFEGTYDSGPDLEISLGALHLHAMLLHGIQMRTTREERDVESGPRHARANVGANGARSHYQRLHA